MNEHEKMPHPEKIRCCGNYLIYDEAYFPAGTFEIGHRRKHYLTLALAFFLETHYNLDPDFADLKNNGAVVFNRDTTDDSFPWISIYYLRIPVIRLFYRNSRYELHLLNPNLPEEVCQQIASDDTTLNHVEPTNFQG
ncbi:MAG: hypothetical protein SFY92_00730 [Verrucomicrobiae bacterium]|nr:hypothetical protein [Verrucomicrobiae bacterium]